MNSHTPAPWIQGPSMDREGGIPIDVDGYRVATAHMRHGKSGQGSGHAQQAANALLIAAAPDMFDSLKSVLAFLNVHANDEPALLLLDYVRTVVAKAKGER